MRTDADKLELQLRRPTRGELYRLVNPSINTLKDGNATDATTGFALGARHHDFQVANESALAVIAILQRNDSKDTFLRTLLTQSLSSENYESVTAIVLQLGLTNLPWSVTGQQQQQLMAKGLHNAIHHCPRTATDGDLADFKRWATWSLLDLSDARTPDGLSSPLTFEFNRLINLIDSVVSFRERADILRGDSPTIDRDRRELIDRLQQLAVGADVRSLLDLADKDATGGDFKGAMEKARTFLERTYESCCRRHKTPEGVDPLPEKNAGGSIAPWLKWATKTGLLKPKEHDVVQALSSFLAMEGSHAPSSEARQYAVGKASVIEWCLLVADRVN